MKDMDHPYWVADYLVDPARNQVTRSQKTYLLQPKVLAVLNILAKNAGKVVSHDTLMDEVWPDTCVSPNTLQRCIAEVRKALGDNSRAQEIIKTHSKQGYSLEVTVKPEIPSPTPGKMAQTTTGSRTKVGLTVLTLLAFFLFHYLLKPQDSDRFETIRPLTASDEKEFYPDYSPDGRYMVFHRYLGVCENHIWAKDLVDQREIQLTRHSAVYGQHSWSSDGTQLAFTVQENCAQDKTEKDLCWQLHTLDFAAAINSPQTTVERLNCENRRISRPLWMTDGSILMIEHSHPTKIVRYQPSTDQLSDFYFPAENTLTHFDIAQKQNLVAVFEQSPELQNSWTLLDVNANPVSSEEITLPADLSVFQRIEPNFTQDEERFLLNTSQGLFNLEFDGQVTPVDIVRPMRLFTPVMHKNNDKILATQGLVDSDIALLDLSVAETAESLPESLARSNSYDAGAKFQPFGSKIAFLSKRSGSSQIWIAEGTHVIQLSQFPVKTHLTSLEWSPDGKRLVTVANDVITILSLDGEQQRIGLSYPASTIFQWINEKSLLIEGNLTTSYQVIILDLADLSSQQTGLEDAKFAYILANNSMLHVDHSRLAWLTKNDHRTQLSELNKELDSKRFVAIDNVLYGINWRHQLWQYDIQSRDLEILAPLHEDIWWVSDIAGTRVLLTTLISSPNEIIELSH